MGSGGREADGECKRMSEQAKVDWRELPAGAGLDRIVAKRLGYVIDIISTPPDYQVNLAKPDGSLHALKYTIYEHIWRDLFNYHIPQFSRDANAALPGDCAVWNISNTWYACYEVQVFENVHEWTLLATEKLVQSGQALAEARSRAWLAWKDVQRE